MTATELSRHAAFYEWFTTTFPTRYTLGMTIHRNKESQGYNNPRTRTITGGKIGLHFSEDDGSHLFYQSADSITGGWIQLFPHTGLLRSPPLTGDKQPVARLALRRHPDSLARRLAYWRETQPFLVERTGIARDLRQLAQLAVILNYDPTSSSSNQ